MVALQESEARYHALIGDLIDSSAVGMLILDADVWIVFVNRALEGYFGFRRVEDPDEDFAEKVLATPSPSSSRAKGPGARQAELGVKRPRILSEKAVKISCVNREPGLRLSFSQAGDLLGVEYGRRGRPALFLGWGM